VGKKVDYYVLRIYRRGEGCPGEITGLLHQVDIQCCRPFKSFAELAAMLAMPSGICRRRRSVPVDFDRRRKKT